jgi:hypothetical protein
MFIDKIFRMDEWLAIKSGITRKCGVESLWGAKRLTQGEIGGAGRRQDPFA